VKRRNLLEELLQTLDDLRKAQSRYECSDCTPEVQCATCEIKDATFYPCDEIEARS